MSDSELPDFLKRLLDAAGPSGFESRASRVWRAEAEGFADQVHTDVHGNSTAVLNPGGTPRVMLAGHIDEIGLQVTHIDEDGFLYFDEIGGWDPQILVGQRVKLLTNKGELCGLVGKKAIHLMDLNERQKVAKTKDLWIDVGASSASEVEDLGIRVGDPAVLGTDVLQLAGDRIASRAIDNRIGAYVVLETIRLLSKEPSSASVYAVATCQEEFGYGGGGARPSAYAIEPDVALVVDVTFSTDVPDISKKEHGDHKVGGGPVLTRGSAVNPVVFDLLASTAEAEEISYTIQAAPRTTQTDADGIYLTRTGVPTGLISVPNRYMHSPNEVVSLRDLSSAARLMAAFVRNLTDGHDFVPR